MKFLWSEQYRPKTIEECNLPTNLKEMFQGFVDNKQFGNLLLSGPPGCGKTTVARALVNQVGGEALFVPASMKGNIDTLRVEVMNFASAMSLDGRRKFVILDEADHLNPTSTQPALRNFIDEFNGVCTFIMTCNYKKKIIEPLQSRTTVIDFVFTGETKITVAKQLVASLQQMLDQEKVAYNLDVIKTLVIKFFPDQRRLINYLQSYANTHDNKIDQGALAITINRELDELIKLIKAKNFNGIRSWIGESDVDYDNVFTQLGDLLVSKTTNPADLIVILADYQYKHAFVADPELNMLAMCVELMASGVFK